MRTTTTVAQMLLRLFGVILIVLGIIFWTGNALSLVNLHMLVGVLFVLVLWLLSGLAAAAHRSAGMVVLGFVWGIIVLALGLTLVLRNSRWARRAFARAKRRWPRFGDLADRGLRRKSARRRRERARSGEAR